MKKHLALFAAAILVACGDETTENVTNVNQMGMEIVPSLDDLSECTEDNQGELALVKGETSVRVCMDGKWFATAESVKDTVYINDDAVSCSTRELADKSGLVIVCNGDSIGVVLNGEKGDAGKDAVLKKDTLENDSEKIATSIASLEGYTQKGPFLKGSTVYLYELSDGRSLKQTNGNFTTYITRDDGRYMFTARDLISQYAMIIVDGVYRNEVTGAPSKTAIRLRALTDVTMRSSANVNLLTHLEYDRVYSLVTRDKKKVKHAKQQAQAEIFKAFHIDTTGSTGASEDLDVFGETDADAALLAISVLLQGDGSETDLTVLLTEIANDMEPDGVWDDSVTRAKIADWALNADLAGRLDVFQENVTKWGLGTAPDFKKYVRKFYSEELRLGVCDGKHVSKGTVRHVSNTGSIYHADTYTDTSGTDESRPERKTRFICDDESSLRWREAGDLDKDRFDWHPENKQNGKVFGGQITGIPMTWDADTLRYAGRADIYLNKACVSYIQNTGFVPDNQLSSYLCTADGWVFDVGANAKTLLDARDEKEYITMVVGNAEWMAENLNYEMANSFCYNDSVENCNEYGRLYTWEASMEACPDGWHLPSSSEWYSLLALALQLVEQPDSIVSHPLKSTSGWDGYCITSSDYVDDCIGIASGNGTDMFGLSILPAGSRYGNDDYRYKGEDASFWLPRKNDDAGDWASFISLSEESKRGYSNGGGDKDTGYSVRCVKDN